MVGMANNGQFYVACANQQSNHKNKNRIQGGGGEAGGETRLNDQSVGPRKLNMQLADSLDLVEQSTGKG